MTDKANRQNVTDKNDTQIVTDKSLQAIFNRKINIQEVTKKR